MADTVCAGTWCFSSRRWTALHKVSRVQSPRALHDALRRRISRAGQAEWLSSSSDTVETRRPEERVGPAGRRGPHRRRRDSFPTSNRCRSRKTLISWNRSLEQREVAVFQKIQSRTERLGATPECRQFDRENRLRGRESHGQRIAVPVVEMEFVMKMWAAGPAGLPDVADDFALDDAGNRPQRCGELLPGRVVR